MLLPVPILGVGRVVFASLCPELRSGGLVFLRNADWLFWDLGPDMLRRVGFVLEANVALREPHSPTVDPAVGGNMFCNFELRAPS